MTGRTYLARRELRYREPYVASRPSKAQRSVCDASNDVSIATAPQKRRILDILHATESGSGRAACARSPASPTTRSAVRQPSSEKPIHVRSS
jgi:hypothetical protein